MQLLTEGMMVRCVDPIPPLAEGETYRVRRIRPNDLFNMVDTAEVSHRNGAPVEPLRPQGFFTWRFKPA